MSPPVRTPRRAPQVEARTATHPPSRERLAATEPFDGVSPPPRARSRTRRNPSSPGRCRSMPALERVLVVSRAATSVSVRDPMGRHCRARPARRLAARRPRRRRRRSGSWAQNASNARSNASDPVMDESARHTWKTSSWPRDVHARQRLHDVEHAPCGRRGRSRRRVRLNPSSRASSVPRARRCAPRWGAAARARQLAHAAATIASTSSRPEHDAERFADTLFSHARVRATSADTSRWSRTRAPCRGRGCATCESAVTCAAS